MYELKAESQARAFAEHHGFKIRHIPYSLKNPNGYVQIVAPNGVQMAAIDFQEALDEMERYRQVMK